MTVEFDDVQRAAAMFAEAVFGRPVRIEMADDQSPSGRRPLHGPLAEHLVVLPATVEAFDDVELDRRLFRHAVLHQAGYELFGTRTFDLDDWCASHPDRPALREVFAAVEDRRIDAAVIHRFPGAHDDVRRAASLAPPPGSASLARALDAIVRRDDLYRWSVDDAARVALALTELEGPFVTPLDASEIDLPSTPDRPGQVGAGGSEEGDDRYDPLLLNVLGFAADVDDVPEGLDGDVPVGDGDLPEEAPRRAAGTTKGDMAGTRARAVRPSAHEPSDDRSFLYDEWDVHACRYLPAWCRVHERPLVGGDPAFIGDVRRRHAALARHVRRQFAMIAAESWRRVHRERDGGELDLDEVVAWVVDRHAGIVDDEHLHIRQIRAEREVAAAFLLDMSASTSTPIVDPDAPPPPPHEPAEDTVLYPGSWEEDEPPPVSDRTILDLAKEALAVMCDALHVLGDEHAIYGFSGSGRDGVEFYVAKELRERPSARTWSRLDAMRPRQYTRMGPAIRHATAKLRAHTARTRFLVVVSDGYPQDRDYGPDRADRSYGIADTAKAIEEAERAGVLTFCITVDPAGHGYLRDMLPEDRYLVIDEVTALPGAVTKVYRSLILARK